MSQIPARRAAAPGRRARRWVVALTAAACALAACHGDRRAVPATPRRAPVYVVGLDGADWKDLDRRIAEGAMPELQRLVREGRRGVLVTEQPPLSPLLWTTMMTGVSPLEHRILDFARLSPVDGRPEPITSSERRVPAIWNMASAGGRSVLVLGLWATYPAETVRGTLVSDRFFSFLHPDEAPARSVFPPERLEWARARLRAAQASVDLATLHGYVPSLQAADLEAPPVAGDAYADPLRALRRILVETATYDALFRDGVKETSPDLAVLYLQGTDSIGHAFARYAPPALPGIDPTEVVRWGNVPDAYFRHVDALLGAYRQLAQERGARLLLVSDHGFRWDADRPAGLSSTALGTAAQWHRDEGIWLLWGNGVQGGNGSRAGVRQVCATLLDLLGLPPGIGLQGPSLAAQGVSGRERARPAVDYRHGYAPPADAPAPATAGGDEALAALRALGYAAGGAPNEARRAAPAAAAGSAPAADRTRTAASFDNEGLILRAAGRAADAQRAFEAALARAPRSASAEWNLSELLRDQPAQRARADQLLLDALRDGLANGAGALASRALLRAQQGQTEAALELAAAGRDRFPEDARAWLLEGQLLLQRERCAAALADFQRAAELAPERADAPAAIAVAQLCLGNESAAAAALRRSLELDPNQPRLREKLLQLGG